MDEITWKQIARDGEYELLITEKIHLYGVFDVSSNKKWANSTIRQYLNREFLHLLPPELVQRIRSTSISNTPNRLSWNDGGPDTLDKVFLLNSNEVLDFFPRQEMRVALDYNTEKPVSWWLRSPGLDEDTVESVYKDGELSADTDAIMNASFPEFEKWYRGSKSRLSIEAFLAKAYFAREADSYLRDIIQYPHITSSAGRMEIGMVAIAEPQVAGVVLMGIRPALWAKI